MINEDWYEVPTFWGWFRLDEAAYRDYLAGKLWITWVPRSMAPPAKEAMAGPDQLLPPGISEDAIHIRDNEAKTRLYWTAELLSGGEYPVIPFITRLGKVPIGELPLSVRASNCLMRSGVSSFGALNEWIDSENGLRSIRNLGKKCEEEIMRCFFEACYHLLTPTEQALYWQKLLDPAPISDKGTCPFME